MTDIEKRKAAREMLGKLEMLRKEKFAILLRVKAVERDMGPSGLRVTNYADERVSGSRSEDIMEDLRRYTELLAVLSDMKDKVVEEELRILAILNLMPTNKYRLVLIGKYINGDTLETVAWLNGYAHETIKEWHRDALLEFYEKSEAYSDLPTLTPLELC